MMQNRLLILPDDPRYQETLDYSLPFFWRQKAESIGQFPNFVVDAETGLMRPASRDEMVDYIYGGEYEQRLDAMNGVG